MIFKTVVCFSVLMSGCLSDETLNYEISAEDIETGIERPCRTFDMFCIREYFMKHSRCQESFGPAPSPLYKSQSNYYVPRVNMSVNSLNVEYTVPSARLAEFYINKKTDKLLLAVDYSGLTFGSNENYFRFYRKGKEPIVTTDTFNVTYTTLVITIIIPNLNDLKLQNSEVFLYANDISPIFSVGPKAFLTPDPSGEQLVLQSFTAFLEDNSSNVIEGFTTDAHFLIASFIKYNICDFCLEIL